MRTQPLPSAPNTTPRLTRRQAWGRLAGTGLVMGMALAAGLPWPAWAETVGATSTSPIWSDTLAQARGQTVYFNAWAGSERINAYIQWAAQQVQQRHGVTVQHVKVADAATVVQRVRSEKAAGKRHGGSVDAVWINGENFWTMKREGLLLGPFTDHLPNARWVDTQGKPTTQVDFSEPVAGMEAPWGMAQFTWMADRQQVPRPPRNMAQLLAFARQHPGRVSYPRPPDFLGTTFLKQAWLELTPQRAALAQPYNASRFAALSAPLWAWLDALHPHLWRQGQQFPISNTALPQMLADGDLLLAFTFNPNEAANEIAAGRLPATVESWQPDAGALANTHFVAIPFNSSASAGAQVFIDFLLSPEAQARKADIAVWGDPTVLATDRLPAAERARFASAPQPGQVRHTAPAWPEPHASWVDPLEREWLRRYGQ